MTDTPKTAEEILRGAGLSDEPDKFDSSIHSWRCEYPDRYGKCTCFQDLVALIESAMAAGKAAGEARAYREAAVVAEEWEQRGLWEMFTARADEADTGIEKPHE